MTLASRVEIRISLAEGHWALGEHAEALRSLEGALEENAEHPSLPHLLATLRARIRAGEAPSELAAKLDALAGRLPAGTGLEESSELDELPALTTSTVAELFAEQGLHDKALRVAEDVLRRRPDDDRARSLLSRLSDLDREEDSRVSRLESWLGRVRGWRVQGGLPR
ncbi:MAG: hypothetical protein V3T14_05250 [Myxococcota bacterium]